MVQDDASGVHLGWRLRPPRLLAVSTTFANCLRRNHIDQKLPRLGVARVFESKMPDSGTSSAHNGWVALPLVILSPRAYGIPSTRLRVPIAAFALIDPG